MAATVVHARSCVEFFREQVDSACERQHLHPQPLTAHYMVSLLSDATRVGRRASVGDEPLGIALLHALDGGGSGRRVALRRVGDSALLLSGFFSDSLRRRAVDVDYFVGLGGCAYRALAEGGDSRAPVFAELSEHFIAFADVLADVGAHTLCTQDTDLLRTYDRWLKTGSRRSASLLVERGVIPNASKSVS